LCDLHYGVTSVIGGLTIGVKTIRKDFPNAQARDSLARYFWERVGVRVFRVNRGTVPVEVTVDLFRQRFDHERKRKVVEQVWKVRSRERMILEQVRKVRSRERMILEQERITVSRERTIPDVERMVHSVERSVRFVERIVLA